MANYKILPAGSTCSTHTCAELAGEMVIFITIVKNIFATVCISNINSHVV